MKIQGSHTYSAVDGVEIPIGERLTEEPQLHAGG
jgi:hypothetical protein